MNRARIGVIGLGRFGVQHARVLAQLPHAKNRQSIYRQGAN